MNRLEVDQFLKISPNVRNNILGQEFSRWKQISISQVVAMTNKARKSNINHCMSNEALENFEINAWQNENKTMDAHVAEKFWNGFTVLQ